ncbi:hypothetical protein E4K65_32225 [Bradyrhizobium niftali]|uniref:Uncharacterized protein n=1 Tax=Bradyrhizobium niftali TaxID=2560055 RepID=A0A4Y9LP52_9BRAD|nr:hypothetical protein E4K65_32225 [Bradyrhizobium niftali]
MPRLDRGIQYAAAPVAAARSPTQASGIQDRPVEPGDDSGGCGSSWRRVLPSETTITVSSPWPT